MTNQNTQYNSPSLAVVTILGVALLGGSISSGCESDTASSDLEDNRAVAAPAWPPERTTSLPVGGGEGDCLVSDAPAPSICEWALSTDAIVVGEIVAIRPVASPSVMTVNGGGVVATCDGVVNDVLDLDINVSKVLHGDVDSTSVVSVRVPGPWMDSHRPMPVVDGDGEVFWVPDDNNSLQVGDTIGAPIHWIDAVSTWSLLAEPLLGARTDGTLFFEESVGDCRGRPTPDLGGRTLNQLASLIGQCPTSRSEVDAAAALNAEKRSSSGIPELRYEWFAYPVCIPSGDDWDCTTREECRDKGIID